MTSYRYRFNRNYVNKRIGKYGTVLLIINVLELQRHFYQSTDFLFTPFFSKCSVHLEQMKTIRGLITKFLVKVTTVVKMIGGSTAWSATYDDTHNADPNPRN